ncbi:MAG: hypothetical protein KGM24_11815 [Elusimicrobia bacterium]|nr:hypothetical protein [Elusimicrobiota bacterium]
MSLKSFHKVFISLCLACCAFVAWWASGHNQQGLSAPWLLAASLAALAALVPYLAWRIRRA